jgi:hypothetical protein
MGGKYGRARRATGDDIIQCRKGELCMPDNYGQNIDAPSSYLIHIAS